MLSVQRRSAGGITTSANYTVSRCEGLINQGGGPLNVATGYMKPVSLLNPPSAADTKAIYETDKGRCSAWRKHILNLTASVQSPQFSSTAARMLASGWRLSGVFRAQSGNPLTVNAGIDRALSGIQATTQRAAVVSGVDPYGDGTINKWLNPAAFAQPALGTYGNAVRNAYDGPGFRTLDLSLVRQFGIGNNRRVEARVEAFNALNWFILGDPGVNLSAATFGRITTTAVDPRVMQFALKYQF